jgi:hypothetical protein
MDGCAQWVTRSLPEHYEAHGIAWFGNTAYAVTQLPGSEELAQDSFNLVVMADGSCASLAIFAASAGLENPSLLAADLLTHKHRLEEFLADLCSLLNSAEAASTKLAMEAVLVAKRTHMRRAERIGRPVRMRFYFSEKVARTDRSHRFEEMLATMAHEAFHLSSGVARERRSPTEQETIG